MMTAYLNSVMVTEPPSSRVDYMAYDVKRQLYDIYARSLRASVKLHVICVWLPALQINAMTHEIERALRDKHEHYNVRLIPDSVQAA